MEPNPPIILALVLALSHSAHGILAGRESGVPTDSPSRRVDADSVNSPFNFIGALEMASSGRTYFGSAVAISSNWVLTAGHNVDLNDDGLPDDGLMANFHLPGFGVFTASGMFTHPLFTGFGNPTIFHDIALLHFDDPLPGGLVPPILGRSSLEVGDVVTIAGFGRSGYGSYGYTTHASLTTRRLGGNTVDSLQSSTTGDGASFRYTFHAPESPLSLGNDIESIIGLGDSGGPALRAAGEGWELVGINTFTEGYGGRFGDIGGGVLIAPYEDWILATTGIPEPGMATLVLVGALSLVSRRSRAFGLLAARSARVGCGRG